MKKNWFGFLALLMILISCKSTRLETRDLIYVMIYDLDNNPVAGADLFVNGIFAGKSDIHGRFFITAAERINSSEKMDSSILIKVSKSGYEEIIQQTEIEDGEVFYFKTASWEQLLERAEILLDEDKTSEALDYIERSEKIAGNKEEIFYLKAVVYGKVNNVDEKLKALEKIKSEKNEPYKKAFLERFSENE